MKTQSIHHTKIVPAFLIALAFSCLVFSAAAQTGNPSIVGLWRVHYFENGAQVIDPGYGAVQTSRLSPFTALGVAARRFKQAAA